MLVEQGRLRLAALLKDGYEAIRSLFDHLEPLTALLDFLRNHASAYLRSACNRPFASPPLLR